jgi:hypothetical protein
MPLPVIPGAARVTLAGATAGGARWSNSWHIQTIGGADPGAAELNTAVGAFSNFYTSVMAGACSVGTTCDAADVTPLDGTSGAIHTGLNILGAAASPSLPAEVSFVLTLRTAQRGRRARGRIFLPAFATNTTGADGHLTPENVAAILADATALLASLTTATFILGVASYGRSVKLDHTVHPARREVSTWTPFITPVTTISLDNVADVIRNRKR